MEGFDFDDAIVEKRLHHGLFPNVVQYEAGFDGNVVQYLQNIGHQVGYLASPLLTISEISLPLKALCECVILIMLNC